jgi:hypothetical protein
MAEIIDAFVLLILLTQLSFGIVNVTGVFPVSESIPGFNYTDIAAEKDKIAVQQEEVDSVLEYTIVLGKLMYMGLKLVLIFILAVFNTIPFILKIFWIPAPIANLIGYAADVLLMFGLGSMLLKRSA